ncbi:MAG: hypothetical protein J6X97_02875 [Lachnospiraceae bacterium]|nr:hypothetical protein [Lachnospiraceae bacterium]
MREKMFNRKALLIVLVVLLFLYAVTVNVISLVAEKINPYDSIMFSGCYETFVFEKHGNHCYICVSDSVFRSDEKEKTIPKLAYYAVVLRVTSLGIENYTGTLPIGCVDGYYCHIHLKRKDGTKIHHVTYEYGFPPSDEIDRIYKFLSAVHNKRLIRHMCTEISHTKIFHDSYLTVRKAVREIFTN